MINPGQQIKKIKETAKDKNFALEEAKSIMRKRFDHWGIEYSQLFPNYSAPYTVECDCGEHAKQIRSYYLYQCQICGKKYTLSFGDYILMKEKKN